MPNEKTQKSPTSAVEKDAELRLLARRKKREERARRRDKEGTPPRRRTSATIDLDDEAPVPRRRPRSVGPEPDRISVRFDPAALDDGAEKVVRRLTKGGHEAYLVGGCVRDLLVGHRPKDFDVATSARPEEVKRLFRNSRIIGRRFRLVHVLFPHGHVIETATFRRNPPESASDANLLIVSDNFFGDAHEDAQRRDFTINGLFYDVERQLVLDWVGGMSDISARTVRTIGDPVVRFQEDPVRILRAVKFAARIDFGISPEVYDAAVQCRGALAMAARPRLSEEVLRLMRGGAAHRSIWLLWEMGLLDVLIPELSAYLSDTPNDEIVWRLLSEVDELTKMRGQPPDDIVLWTALLLEPLLEACHGAPDRLRSAHDFLEPVVERLNLPRRSSDAIRRIVAILPRLSEGKASRLKRNALYDLANEVLVLRQAAAQGTGTTGAVLKPPPRSRSRGNRGKRAPS
jgi:poly(A) polymerase